MSVTERKLDVVYDDPQNPTVGDLHGYGRGWYVVSWSDELSAGDVKPLHYFGRELVLFRTQSGKPVVLDAHCPHLGAHLGYGGRVEGEIIACPFHAWEFGEAGVCTRVPYSDKIPPRARLKSWTVDERNGLIFVWYSRQGEAPGYEIPLLGQCEDPDWSGWSHNIKTIATHGREIVENVADKAHFMPVHGTQIDRFENRFEGHQAEQQIWGTAYPRGGGKDNFHSVTTYFGPAYQTSIMDGLMPSILLNCHTPIDGGQLHLRFGVMLKKQDSDDKTRAFADGYIRNLEVGFGEDVKIWENKRWRDRPLLSGTDGPIVRLRRWYAQFYEDPAPEQ